MKSFLFLSAVLTTSHAQQEPTIFPEPAESSAVLSSEVSSVFTPAVVLETTVTHQGERDVIVQQLALDPKDPLLPVVTELPVAIPADSDVHPSETFSYSATVYPGARTFLFWTHHYVDGTSRDFSGWSNIDFNHLTTITSFLGNDGEHHACTMSIGNEQLAAESAPLFATEAPTFIPDGEIPAEALVAINSLHAVYAADGTQLAATHAVREQYRLAAENEAERSAEAESDETAATEAELLAEEAELLANPPPPMDLIIRYRIAETPLPTTPAEGGAQ